MRAPAPLSILAEREHVVLLWDSTGAHEMELDVPDCLMLLAELSLAVQLVGRAAGVDPVEIIDGLNHATEIARRNLEKQMRRRP